MNRRQRKVLVVTYYFPPSGGAGVQRPLKFVRYLREFGWEPVVLTARDADYPAFDESLLQEVPAGVKVYRSRILEPYRLYRRFTGRRMDEATDIATLTRDEAAARNFKERLAEFVRAAFFVPDARIAWLFFAVPLGLKILRAEKIDAIFSTAPPYTTNLIGLFLHRFSGVPWVADFRDSWIGWLSAPQWRPRLARALELWMEESVLRYSSRVLAVSHGVKEDLLSRHPHLRDDRWIVLPNGYDRQDFQGVQPKPLDRRITITYTGSLYGNRNPEFLLQALERLLERDKRLGKKLLIRFVGRVGEPILRRIGQSPARDLIEHIPYVPHRESLSYLLASDYALLIIDDAPVNRGILTGKLFEYIGSGIPILALAPEGDAAELIRKYRLGYVVPPKDANKIEEVLTEILRRGRPCQSGVSGVLAEQARSRFERRNLTAELAKILDSVTKEGE
ncbi:MAG TPA: glycosyl transferase family 1 [Bacteroidetes bacterium]|nr:glycosyl transferase family 1 [Bacteroidota bacterium]